MEGRKWRRRWEEGEEMEEGMKEMEQYTKTS